MCSSLYRIRHDDLFRSSVRLVLLKVHTLIGNKEYLEKQIKESENNLRELVMAKKNSSS